MNNKEGKQPENLPAEARVHERNVVMLENAIARGSFRLSPSALKLFYIAAAAAQITDERFTYVKMDIEDVVPLIDPARTGYTYENLFEWGRELRRSEIILEGQDEKSVFGWITFVKQTKTTIEVEISPSMKEHVARLQKNFQRSQLAKMATFHGRHALRLYGILMSFSGQAKNGQWTVRLTLEELRWKLQVVSEYPKVGMFALRCVDDPVKEINARDVGISVTVERVKRRRRIVGFEFLVKYVARKPKERRANPPPATPSEAELKTLVEKYPDQWEQFLKDAATEVDRQQELFSGVFAVPRDDRIKVEAERLLREWVKKPPKEKRN